MIIVPASAGIPSTPAAAVTIPSMCSAPGGTIQVFSPLGAYEYSSDGINYQASPLFTGMLPATYSITVRRTADNTCISLPVDITIIRPSSSPPPPVSNGDQAQCETTPIQQLTASATTIVGVVVWYTTPTGGTPVSPVLNTIGTKTFYAETVDDTCISASRTPVTLTIYQRPTAGVSISGANTLCIGDSTRIRIDLTGTPPWNLVLDDATNQTAYNNVMSSPITFLIYPTSSSVYSVTSLSDQHCTGVQSGMTSTAIVTVNAKPDIDFTYAFTNNNYEAVFTATVNPNQFVSNNITWDFGDGLPSMHGSIVTHTFPGYGTFYCTRLRYGYGYRMFQYRGT